MKSNKKAFTIVELVVVIAIIAVLAAVLIPTFANIIKKANISKDTQLIRNLNTALASSRAANNNKPHPTMYDALQAAEEFGYDIGKINASATGNEILWDQENDVFCYLEGEKIAYLPELVDTNKQLAITGNINNKPYHLWKIFDDNHPFDTNQKFSIYWNGTPITNDPSDPVHIVAVGFDAGTSSVANLSYTNENTGREVVIRTNGGTLTVGSSEAVAKGQIWHYGTLDKAIIYTENTCFHTHGKIGNMELKAGKAIAEDNGYVALLKASAGTLVEEKDTGVFYIPSNATTATVDAAVAATLGYTVTNEGTTADETRSAKIADFEWIIYNAEELAYFRDVVNDGMTFSGMTVKLGADIDLNNEAWTPIGIKDLKSFSGIFDGQSHKIRGLFINGGKYKALFARGENATFKNFTVEGFVAGENVSGVCAQVIGCSFENIVNKVNIDSSFYFKEVGSSVQIAGKAGGLVSYIKQGGVNYFKNCINYGSITTTGDYAAGLIAGTDPNITLTIENCENHGNVTGNNNCLKVGGLIGRPLGTITITDSINTGTIQCNTTTNVRYVGGIIGEVEGLADRNNVISLNNVTNTGNVIGHNTNGTGVNRIYVGGIFGSMGANSASFKNLTNSGEVSGMIAGGIGGTIGENKTNNEFIEDAILFDKCVNTGTVIGNAKTATGFVCTAGLVGNIDNGYITFNGNCSAKEATISIAEGVNATTELAARLIGNIINNGCRNLVVYIPETIGNDTLNTFGKIGTTVYDPNGNPSTIYYYGTINGTTTNVDNLSLITKLD